MDRIGIEENQPIEHGLISKAIENAQRRVEGQNFEMRKHLLEYDDVMNRQRKVIYEQRKKALKGEELEADIDEMIEEIASSLTDEYIDEDTNHENWNLKGLEDVIFKQFSLKMKLAGNEGKQSKEAIADEIIPSVRSLLAAKEQEFGKPMMAYLQKVIMLQTIDNHWKDHLLAMDHLKEGIGLRGYGQKDPIREYQKEGYEMFMGMVQRIKEDSIAKLCMVQIQREEEIDEIRERSRRDYVLSRGDDAVQATVKRAGEKVGRNDPCPCGSGKKYKKCCGR
jgi:preprotein translocase subunit SecA